MGIHTQHAARCLKNDLRWAARNGEKTTTVIIPDDADELPIILVSGERVPDEVVLDEFAAWLVAAFVNRREKVTVKMSRMVEKTAELEPVAVQT